MKRPTLEEMTAKCPGPANLKQVRWKNHWIKTTSDFWWNHCTDLSPAERCVLISLKLHANSEGKCWPGIRGLAKRLTISPSTVLEAIRGLEREKKISTKVRGHRMNEYLIL